MRAEVLAFHRAIRWYGPIVRLAQSLITLLKIRDPLSERVHLGKLSMALHGLKATATTIAMRLVQLPERR